MTPEDMIAALRRRPVALSIRQPWCHHILHDGKDVENRGWRTRFRGLVLIHASRRPDDIDLCRRLALPLGGIVGAMEIVDCVDAWDSGWWCGPHGFVIRNPRPLPFVPCRGALGFFRPGQDVIQALAAATASEEVRQEVHH